MPPKRWAASPKTITAARFKTDEQAIERFRKANDVFSRQLTKLWHDHGDHRSDAF